jgi:hypothetical protein
MEEKEMHFVKKRRACGGLLAQCLLILCQRLTGVPESFIFSRVFFNFWERFLLEHFVI